MRDDVAQFFYAQISCLDGNNNNSGIRVRSDDAKKLLDVRVAVKKMGTHHTTISALTFKFNRMAQSMNQNLLNKVQTMMSDTCSS